MPYYFSHFKRNLRFWVTKWFFQGIKYFGCANKPGYFSPSTRLFELDQRRKTGNHFLVKGKPSWFVWDPGMWDSRWQKQEVLRQTGTSWSSFVPFSHSHNKGRWAILALLSAEPAYGLRIFLDSALQAATADGWEHGVCVWVEEVWWGSWGRLFFISTL